MDRSWIPSPCRFPAPTGDRVVNVAATLAWHRNVRELFLDEVVLPRLTARMRELFRQRQFPDTTGAPADAYTAILRWRDSILGYCEQACDLIYPAGEPGPTPRECNALAALLRPDDDRPRSDQCLEAPHLYGTCPLFHPDWPYVPPEYAELLPKIRWWQFWLR